MLIPEDFEYFKDILDRNDYSALRTVLAELNDVDIADLLADLPINRALLVFRMLNKEKALHVFSLFNDDMQQQVINAITDREVGVIINDLWVDDAVDMLEEMPAALVDKVLQNSLPEVRDRINQYFNYPEYSAGRIMTAGYIDFKKDITVAEALRRLKNVGGSVETIYTCFVTNETRILEGELSLKDLLLARDEQRVGELMSPDPVFATTTDDQESAAQLIAKYHLISLPVVDREKRLVGIITVDDAMDVLVEEATEDFEKMAAIRPSEAPYVKTSAFQLAKNRFPWLFISLLTNLVISFVVDYYAPVYVAMPILVSFMPMLMGTGGNAGSQTSTLVIRGMAIGEIALSDFLRVQWKEIRVCLLLSITLAAINFARICIFQPGNTLLALIVSVALICGMLVGKITGAALPLLAKKVHVDPALMASPIITTIVDVAAVAVFFTLARVTFRLP